MSFHHKFHPSLILRTPTYTLNTNIDEDFILNLLQDNLFLEGLFLASAELYQECLKWRDGTITDSKKIIKIIYSITKYYLRASSRCTPFGLFAGCSVIKWEDRDDVQLSQGEFKRHSRLDMGYLCTLVQEIEKKKWLRLALRYYPNNSIYQIGDEIRYIEWKYIDNRRAHQINSVFANQHLLLVIRACREGLQLVEIASILVNNTIKETEAITFIHELINARLLISELEPAVTGQDFLYQILSVLKNIVHKTKENEPKKLVQVLEEVAVRLQTLDTKDTDSMLEYEAIANLLSTLDIPFHKKHLFQVDMIPSLTEGRLKQKWQENLLEVMNVMDRLIPDQTNERLENFKTKFLERYEDQEMSLLEILDTESGINYNRHNVPGGMTLIEDLKLPEKKVKEKTVSLNEAQQYLYKKLLEAEKKGSRSVEILPDEIKHFLPGNQPTPPSISVLFRLVGNNTLLFEGAGGSSAINLVGRFAQANPELLDTIRQITQMEQDANKDIIFAEIIHLPESRIGNILLRPILHHFEIPYLAKSSLPTEGHIMPQDLFVSVRHNQVILRSATLNKIIVPRLSTAHNYIHQSMPVYQFLCDLQTEGLKSDFHFSWSTIAPQRKFWPRLIFKNIILQPATWKLAREDFQELLTEKEVAAEKALEVFINFWQLPRFFILAEQDNELLVDLQIPLTVKSWIEGLKNKDHIILKEFLYDPTCSVVKDEKGSPYTNQFIAPLINKDKCYSLKYISPMVIPGNIQRNFYLGSEWLYYKIYCGDKFADRILIEVIKPFTKVLKSLNLIDKWFFVRYSDSESHLRLRFRLPNIHKLGEIIVRFNQHLEAYILSGCIWKIQTDTYVRELKRYGSHTIELAEDIFCLSSQITLDIIAKTVEDEGEDIRWLWGLKLISAFLDAFEFQLSEKLMVVKKIKEVFSQEFSMDKRLRLQLDQKYRHYRTRIDQVLQNREQEEQEPEVLNGIKEVMKAFYVPLNALAQNLKQINEQNQPKSEWSKLLESFIHMQINRLISSNQRLHEMIIYDFLFRYYQSQTAKMNVRN